MFRGERGDRSEFRLILPPLFHPPPVARATVRPRPRRPQGLSRAEAGGGGGRLLALAAAAASVAARLSERQRISIYYDGQNQTDPMKTRS